MGLSIANALSSESLFDSSLVSGVPKLVSNRCDERTDSLNSDKASSKDLVETALVSCALHDELLCGVKTRAAPSTEDERPARSGAMAWPALLRAAPDIFGFS